nr:MAG TPA: hypothetical protein [Bacteriophage sp.]
MINIPFTDATPVVPKFYWDVKSQEQRIKIICCLIQQLIDQYGSTDSQINQNTNDIAELKRLFEQFQQSGFDDYYATQIEQWFNDNAWRIYQLIAKQVYFGLTSDGYFCAYVPDSWKEITFDTGAVYGTEEYGRLILRFDADGHGIIDNTGRDVSVMSDTIDSRLKAAAGRGLEFANDQLNVKLKHGVDNDVSDEWAVTSDGVYSYAPSKAETTAQPTKGVFTNVLDGVTLTLQDTTRIGGLIAFGLRVQTDENTTISAATRIAKTPGWIKGTATAVNNTGNNTMKIDAIGISCAKSIAPRSDTYFWCVCKYNG